MTELIIIFSVVIVSITIAQFVTYGTIKNNEFIFETFRDLSERNFDINQFDKSIVSFGEFGSKRIVVTTCLFPGIFSKFYVLNDSALGIGTFRIYRFSKTHRLINKFYKNKLKYHESNR